MKKMRFLSVVLAFTAAAVFFLPGCKRPGRDNTLYTELKIYPQRYGAEVGELVLPIVHKRLSFEGSEMRFKSETGKEEMFSSLKEQPSFVERYENTALFLCDTTADGQKWETPQYVLLEYVGEYDGKVKEGVFTGDYEYYIAGQTHFLLSEEGDLLSDIPFPAHYAENSSGQIAWLTLTEGEPVKTPCSFEMFAAYYERLGSCFVSAAENEIVFRANAEDPSGGTELREMTFRLVYGGGTVTVFSET